MAMRSALSNIAASATSLNMTESVSRALGTQCQTTTPLCSTHAAVATPSGSVRFIPAQSSARLPTRAIRPKRSNATVKRIRTIMTTQSGDLIPFLEIKKSGRAEPPVLGRSVPEGDGQAGQHSSRTGRISKKDAFETATGPSKIFESTQTLLRVHKCMQKEGDGRKMATAYGGRRDEEECCVDGESCPKLDEANNLEGRIVCLPEIPTQEEQSPDVILARATEACGFVRLKETPSNILAGCHDLFENWEPGRLGNRGGGLRFFIEKTKKKKNIPSEKD